MFDSIEWRGVPNYPKYEVSSEGGVRSWVSSPRYGTGWRLKTPTRATNGMVVGLVGDDKTTTMTLQRVVALAWLGPPPSALHKWIAFKDGDHENYRPANLEWTTSAPGKGVAHRRRSSHGERTALAALLKAASTTATANVAQSAGLSASYVAKLTPGRDYTPRDRSSPSSTISGTPPDDPLVEEWRAIPSCEGYDVSSFGRVRSWRQQQPALLAEQTTTSAAYKQVSLNGKAALVHRLVADAFCPGQTDERNQVNHKDGDGANNYFDNLEWLSASENSQHAHDAGLWAQGSSHGQRMKRPPVSAYSAIVMAVKGGASAELLAQQNDWDERLVRGIAAGHGWANDDDAFPEEKWKSVPGAPKHEVSSYGRARRAFNHKLLKISLRADGYPAVSLPVEGGWRYLRVHRLVAAAFVPVRDVPGAVFVNHKDGVKENAHFSNLEWLTPSENSQHAHQAGLVSPRQPQRHAAVSTIPTQDGEEWLPVADNLFVSSFGRVASVRREVARLLTCRGRFVKIDGVQTSIHALVAARWLPPPPSPHHFPIPIDGDDSNSRADNLEWAIQRKPFRRAKTRRDAAHPLGGTGRGTNKGRLASPEAEELIQQVAAGQRRPSDTARLLGVTCAAVSKRVRQLRLTHTAT